MFTKLAQSLTTVNNGTLVSLPDLGKRMRSKGQVDQPDKGVVEKWKLNSNKGKKTVGIQSLTAAKSSFFIFYFLKQKTHFTIHFLFLFFFFLQQS